MDLSNKKVLLAEDDPIYSIWIKMVLEEIGINNILYAVNVKKAIEEYQTNLPDLIICDIFLEGKQTGIDLIKELQSYQIPIIVMTNSIDKALYAEVKKVQHVNYLVKPFQPLSLISIIENIFNELESSKNSKLKEPYIAIKNHENVYVKVYLNDILYLEADKNYTYLYTLGKKIALKRTLLSLISDLNTQFIRIHKSFIVNKIHVTSWNSETVTLTNQSNIPIGRKFLNDFLKEIEK